MRLELEIPEVALQQPSWVYWTAGVIAYLLVATVFGRLHYRYDDKAPGGGPWKSDNERVGWAVFASMFWPIIAAVLAVGVVVLSYAELLRVGNKPQPGPSPKDGKA